MIHTSPDTIHRLLRCYDYRSTILTLVCSVPGYADVDLAVKNAVYDKIKNELTKNPLGH